MAQLIVKIPVMNSRADPIPPTTMSLKVAVPRKVGLVNGRALGATKPSLATMYVTNTKPPIATTELMTLPRQPRALVQPLKRSVPHGTVIPQ